MGQARLTVNYFPFRARKQVTNFSDVSKSYYWQISGQKVCLFLSLLFLCLRFMFVFVVEGPLSSELSSPYHPIWDTATALFPFS
jgi:hypothetical protein